MANSRVGVSIKSGNVRIKPKVLFRGGVNPTSGGLAVGTRVRVVHSPKKGIRKFG